MSDNLYLFANNNNGQAENNGSYRLYDMKIEGDSEGVESGVNYVDYLEGDGASYIDTGIITNENTQIIATVQLVKRTNYCKWFGSDKITAGWQITDNNGEFLIQGNGTATDLRLGTNLYDKKIWKMDTSKVIIGEKIYLINIDGEDKLQYTITKNENSTKSLLLFASYHYGILQAIPGGFIQGKVFDFKVYKDNSLNLHLRPCLDTKGVPCMYDEVSKRYFYNQGTGTFKYKKTLRDFQPVLDSNNVPCLLDKIKNKFYYDKNGEVFKTKEKVKYRKIPYIVCDGASWIDTGFNITNIQGYDIEIKATNCDVGNIRSSTLFGGGNSTSGVGNNIVGVFTNYYYKFYGVESSSSKEEDLKNNKIYYGTNINTIYDKNIYIGAINGRNEVFPSTNGVKLYYYKLFDTNDNLVQHLIPAMDTNNNVGMYDLITDTFFYNQGTGEFSYGIEELDAPQVDYVEYLKSDLNSYIDTGKKFDNTWTRIESKYKCVMGWADKLFTSNRFLMRMNYGGGLFQYKDENNVDKTIGTASYNELGVDKKSWVDLNIVWTPNNVTVNNITKTYEGVAQSSKDNILLLEYSSYYIYYWKVYDANNQLIQDLRPCLDKDGTPCMYDTVSQQYFYNQGTGEFLYGDRIGYTPIEYIESTGTQYIDTEVVPTSNTDIEMTCRVCDYNETPTLTNSYIMNGLQINNNTYQYNSIDTTVQPNLVASTGATLTMGSTNLALLDEDDIETATNNGWSLV